MGANLSVLGVLNGSFLVLWAVSMPCYAVYIHTDRGGLLSHAGELVEQIWYPGAHTLRVGVEGRKRYIPSTKDGLLRGACIVCPADTAGNLKKGEGKKYTELHVPANRKVKDCIRVGADPESGSSSTLRIKGPPSMLPSAYVCFQLFGDEHWLTSEVVRGIRQGSWAATGMGAAKRMLDATGYNRKMFPSGHPWQFAQMLSTQDVYSGIGDALGRGEYYKIGATVFIPPKLHVTTTYPAFGTAGKPVTVSSKSAALPKGLDTGNYLAIDGGWTHAANSPPLWPVDTLVRDFVATYPRSEAQAEWLKKNDNGHAGYDLLDQELEYWVPTATADNSIFAWSEDDFHRYALRFLASDGPAIYCGSLQ